MDTKICTVCGQEKPLNDFYKHSGCKGGLRPECKKCKNARGRGAKIKYRYGLTESEFDNIKSFGCNVCGSTEDLHLDHNHKTGKVRGCLCAKCNHALGLMKDNPMLIRKLADYVEVTDA
jgi:hypothetical protein